MQTTAFLMEWISKGEIVSKINEDDENFGATKKYNSLMHDFEVHFNSLIPTIIYNIGNTTVTFEKKIEKNKVTVESLDREIYSSSTKISENIGKKRVKIVLPNQK